MRDWLSGVAEPISSQPTTRGWLSGIAEPVSTGERTMADDAAAEGIDLSPPPERTMADDLAIDPYIPATYAPPVGGGMTGVDPNIPGFNQWDEIRAQQVRDRGYEPTAPLRPEYPSMLDTVAPETPQQKYERIARMAQEDAQAASKPMQLDRNIQPSAEYLAGLGLPSTQAPEQAAPPVTPQRQFSSPEEQAVYDKTLAATRRALEFEKDRSRYAAVQASNEEADYAAMPGQSLPLGVREIGAGLARAGLGLGSIPYAAADAVTGSDYTRDISQAKENVSTATERAGHGQGPAWARRALSGAAESLATSLAGGPLGSYGAIATGAATSASDALGEAKQAGLTGVQAGTYATVQGLLEAGLEVAAQRVGLGGIEDVIGGNKASAFRQGLGAATADAIKTGIIESGTEIPTAILQEVAKRVISDNKVKTAETFEDYRDLIGNTIAQTMVAGGLTHAPQIAQGAVKTASSDPVELARQIASQGKQAVEDALARGDTRRLLDMIPLPKGVKETISKAQRSSMLRELERIVQEQPELMQAKPTERVGSQFADELASPTSKPENIPYPTGVLDKTPGIAGLPQTQIGEGLPDITPGQTIPESTPADQTISQGLPSKIDEPVSSGFEPSPAPTESQAEIERAIADAEKDDADSGYIPDQKEIAPDPNKKYGPLLDDFDSEQTDRLKKRLEGDRRQTIVNPHPVTGLLEGKWANQRLAELSVERAIAKGTPVSYVEGDFVNLGGLNGYMGQTAADKHLRAITKLFTRYVPKSADIALTHKGGDEYGFHFVGMTADQVRPALEKAMPAIQAYAKKHNLDKIAHTKLGKGAGVGVNYAIEQFDPDVHKHGVYKDKNGKDINLNQAGALIFAADQRLELEKKKNGKVKGEETGAQRGSVRPAVAGEQSQANVRGEGEGAVPSGPAQARTESAAGGKPVEPTRGDSGVGNIQGLAGTPSTVQNKPAAKPSKPVSRFEDIVPAIQKLLGRAPGRIGLERDTAKKLGKDVRGYYDRFQEVVRVGGKDAGSIHVWSHEVAHHLDKVGGAVNSVPANVKSELAKMDYDPQQARPSEGFAEFMYDYLNNDGRRNGTVKAWFESDFLGKSKKLADEVAKIKDAVESYNAQAPEDRIAADQGKHAESPDTRDSAKVWSDRMARTDMELLDKFAGQEQAQAKADEKAGRKTDITTVGRQLVAESKALIADIYENGAKDIHTGKRLGPGFKDIYSKLGPKASDKRIDDLFAYAEAKNTADHIAEGIPTAVTKDDANATIQKFSNDQQMIDAHADLIKFSHGLLDMAVNSGNLDPKEAKAMKDKWPNYVPFSRVMEYDPIKKALGRGGEAFKPLHGSGRQIRDIRGSLMDNVRRITLASTKAANIGAWAQYADKPGMAEFIEANAPEGGKDSYTIFKDGKYRTYRMDPVIAHSIEMTYSPARMEGIAKFASDVGEGFAYVKRLGATGLSLGFQLTNLMRDFGAAVIRTKGSAPKMMYRLIGGSIKAAHDTLSRAAGGEGNVWGKALRELGVQSHSVGGDFDDNMAHAQDLIDRMRGQGWKKYLTANPFKQADNLAEVIGFLEMAPRIAEMIQVAEQNGYSVDDFKSGKPMPLELRAAVGQAARDITLDFQQGGRTLKAFNRWHAFANVAWQGSRQMVRSFGVKGFTLDKKQFAKTFIRATATMTAPMVALWIKNKDDEEYKKLPAWRKMYFWNFKWGDTMVSVPRVDGYSLIFAGVPEMMLNKAYGDKDAGAEMMKEIEAQGVDLKSFLPDAVIPAIELYANKDWRGRDIVDKDNQGLVDTAQQNQYTSDFAKTVGPALGMSPIKLDYAIKGYTGGLGRDIVKLDFNETFGRRVTADVSKSKSIDKFYEESETAAKEAKTAKRQGRRDSEAEKRSERFADVKGLISDIRDNAAQNGDDRSTVNRYISGLADYALGNEPTKAYPLPDEAAPDSVKDAFSEYVIRLVSQANKKRGRMTPTSWLNGMTPESKAEEWVRSTESAKKDLEDLGLDMKQARDLVLARQKEIAKMSKAAYEKWKSGK